eukprot:TRINITY_DN7677_c0_g1_i1.p1 TRINITY_DN7677_c0_g1~~TRINITY_DN7677_c0_g1_i1.p1  ORF type:complete len:123 (+),score=25.61 TRINITY_DN7677_c0_g1_i1:667-1035(+)
MEWSEALKSSLELITSREAKMLFTTDIEYSELSKGGFAPDVYRATIYFVNGRTGFSECLDESIAFAGSSNFCPVLVGALLGAIYGVESIKPIDLEHVPEGLIKKLDELSDQLINSWNPTTKT